MKKFITTIILALAACDPARTPITPREAPDVPWPSVDFDGEVAGPDEIGAIIGGCFDGTELFAKETAVAYSDEAPDADDQQAAQICVTWSAHLDRADCVRRGLIKAGLTPVPNGVP